MKNLTKTIFIPPGSSERFVNLSGFTSEYFDDNVFMTALCTYKPGYFVRYPESRRHNILFCRYGEFYYTYNDISGVLRPGEILVMPSGSYQEFYSTTDAGSLFFLLKPDSVWGEPEFRHEKSENNELICLLMEKVAAISDSKAPENFSVAMGQTIFHLLREELHQSGDGRTIFQQLKNKMQLYPQKQWSVEKMAEACGVSTSYFFTLCRKYYQCPPYQLLKKFRMEQAGELLRSTSYSIKVIADMCGYEHPFSFSRSFRKCYGISPAAFRKKI